MIARQRTGATDTLFEGLLWAAAVVSVAAVVAILGFLVYFCLPLVTSADAERVLAWEWQPYAGAFGILPMVVASLCMAAIAVVVAFPLAIGVCCFTQGLAPRPLQGVVVAVVHFMTSIPTIVYAAVAAAVLPPMLRAAFEHGSGFCLLGAALMLAVLILPTIVLLIRAVWRGLAGETSLTCAALGLTKSQELFWVTLPSSGRGLAIAGVLGFGRAIGDTMIALLVAGNAPQVPTSLLDSVRALTAHIACVVATDSGSMAYRSVFACGLILLLTTGGLSLAARWLETSFRTRATHAKVV